MISFANQLATELEFSSPSIHPAIKDIGALGSGKQKDGEDAPLTHGSITIKTGWGTDPSGRILAPDLRHIQMVILYLFN